jgi:O-antigen/teichoic acid export membrane protein
VLIRQTLAYMPAQLIGPLSQFATAIVLTHWLGAADYGLTMLVFAAQELVFLICLSWWSFYMMRYSGSITEEEQRERYLRSEATILLLTTALQVIATIAIILATEPGVSKAFYFGAVVFTVSRSFLNFLSERARTLGAIREYSLIQIAAPLGGLLMTILVMYTIGAKPGWVLLVFAIMQALVAAFVAGRLGVSPWPGRVDRAILIAALTFGIPVVVSGAFGWVAGNGIRFVVQYMLGAEPLGLLSVGWGLATRLSAVAALVVTAAAYPLAVKAMERGDAEGARRQISENSALLFGIVAPATIGVIMITEPLTQLLIAREFQAATIAILPWALLGAAIRNIRMHGWDQLYLLMEKPKLMMGLEGIEALVTVVFAAIGAWFWGILGAVVGTLVAAVVVAIGDFMFLNRHLGLSAPFLKYLRISIATALMAGAIYALPRLGYAIRADWLSLLGVVIIGMAVYALALVALFPGEVRGIVREAKARFSSG